MRAILLTATAAVILATPALGQRAEAMTFAGTPVLSAAAAGTVLQRHAAVVCSYNGCARVHTSRVPPRRPRP